MNQVNAVTIGSSGHWLGSVRQKGQSMVEYMVVIAALVFALHTSGAIDELIDVLKKNYQGYSYAISISDYPD